MDEGSEAARPRHERRHLHAVRQAGVRLPKVWHAGRDWYGREYGHPLRAGPHDRELPATARVRPRPGIDLGRGVRRSADHRSEARPTRPDLAPDATLRASDFDTNCGVACNPDNADPVIFWAPNDDDLVYGSAKGLMDYSRYSIQAQLAAPPAERDTCNRDPLNPAQTAACVPQLITQWDQRGSLPRFTEIADNACAPPRGVGTMADVREREGGPWRQGLQHPELGVPSLRRHPLARYGRASRHHLGRCLRVPGATEQSVDVAHGVWRTASPRHAIV